MNVYGRVYEKFPTWRLIRLKTFFITCKFPFFIKNLHKIYERSSRIFGRDTVNKLIKSTYGDIFLAGENPQELKVCMKELKADGLIGIADYAREFLTKEEEKTEMDSILKMYKDSIDTAIDVDNNNSIALKISSFGNDETLRIMNQYQLILLTIEDGLINGISSADIIHLLNNQKLKHQMTREKIDEIKKIKNSISYFDLNIFEILLSNNIQDIKILQNVLNISNEELELIKDFSIKINERLLQILEHAIGKKCLIMVDAEQSYLRYISDNIVARYFRQFNKDTCIIATTLQCYLKSEPHHLKRWLNFCNENNLKFGLKLVRGAYMNEESRLAQLRGVESPICSTYQMTTENYNKSIELLFQNYKNGDRFCIATHNLGSIELVGKLLQDPNNKNKDGIICAQLLGIAEHATGFSRQLHIKNAKYVPFGNFDILIPYLMRRAEESTMVEKLTTQNELLNKELWSRFYTFLESRKI